MRSNWFPGAPPLRTRSTLRRMLAESRRRCPWRAASLPVLAGSPTPPGSAPDRNRPDRESCSMPRCSERLRAPGPWPAKPSTEDRSRSSGTTIFAAAAHPRSEQTYRRQPICSPARARDYNEDNINFPRFPRSVRSGCVPSVTCTRQHQTQNIVSAGDRTQVRRQIPAGLRPRERVPSAVGAVVAVVCRCRRRCRCWWRVVVVIGVVVATIGAGRDLPPAATMRRRVIYFQKILQGGLCQRERTSGGRTRSGAQPE
jgi:hypothetical protein